MMIVQPEALQREIERGTVFGISARSLEPTFTPSTRSATDADESASARGGLAKAGEASSERSRAVSTGRTSTRYGGGPALSRIAPTANRARSRRLERLLRFRMLARSPIWLCLFALACGGAECPAVDEDALRARIREEVLAELRADNEAALRQAARELEVAPELTAVPRLRVETAQAPRRGAAQPLVTLVMFSDYQCPFCARLEPVLRRLLETYPDELQIVFRNNPLAFHQDAMPAAEAALEAYDQGGDATFWPFHDLLFENQRSLSRASLESYATQLGLDMGSFVRALDAHEHQTRIEQDQRDAARVGARGTPTSFINGRKLEGAQPYEAFDAIVQEELATARRLLEADVPRSQLYARFMREAREVPPPDPTPSAPSVARPTPDPSAIYRVPVAGRPSLGSDDALVTIIDEERARAERALRQGTPRAGLYDALVRDGATSPQMIDP